jgi:hypothetical protein
MLKISGAAGVVKRAGIGTFILESFPKIAENPAKPLTALFFTCIFAEHFALYTLKQRTEMA